MQERKIEVVRRMRVCVHTTRRAIYYARIARKFSFPPTPPPYKATTHEN